MYLELTDPDKIKAAQKMLSNQLTKELPYKRNRTIGYPSGYFEAEVRFADKKGDDISWWLGRLDHGKHGDVYLNFFGLGNPETTNTLLIDLQFNFSYEKFTRSRGGVFVKEPQTGKTVLGHRGIVTRGKSRVPRELLLQEADVAAFQVTSDVRPGNANVLLVTPIDKTGIITDIRDFCAEIRRAASSVMGSDQDNAQGSKNTDSKLSFLDSALKDYFDEFAGTTTSSRSGGQVNMDCRHGTIVRALRDKFVNQGTPYKSQAIDLAVKTEDKVLLFEIKTCANSQSIYTGIGQLYIHGATLSRKFSDKEVVRYLVIPIAPKKGVQQIVLEELGIHLMPFKMAGQKVVF